MDNNEIGWRVAALWLLFGASPIALWHLVVSLWGWRRGESFGYSSRRMAIHWDRARFRHAAAVLTLFVTAGLGALGWWLCSGIPRLSFCAGVLLGYGFPLPGQLLVLAFKLYGVYPARHPGVPSFGGGTRSVRGPAAGRDP